jgi:endonuclease/exonuclease/phosphatase (EEP) superfamily protein YafD
VYLAGVALLFLMGKQRRSAIFAGIFAVVNAAAISPLILPAQQTDTSNTPYRLLLQNVLTSNPNHDLLRNWILKNDPDVVVLIEVNQRWLNDLALENVGYSYNVEVPRPDNFGIAVYSKHPIVEHDILFFSDFRVENIAVTIDLGGTPMTVVGIHPPPPKRRDGAEFRNQHIRNATAFAAMKNTPAIVAGDLNLTPFSPWFRTFTQRSSLRSSQNGFGFQGTWPAQLLPLFRIPIDHVLISDEINVMTREVGPPIGSDHLGIILDFTLKAP